VPDVIQEFDDLGEEKMEYPPLIEAIIKNDEDKFLKLINSKVDLNQRDPNGMAPIHHALFLGKMLDILLKS
jgi:ankyrin repeat protein